MFIKKNNKTNIKIKAFKKKTVNNYIPDIWVKIGHLTNSLNFFFLRVKIIIYYGQKNKNWNRNDLSEFKLNCRVEIQKVAKYWKCFLAIIGYFAVKLLSLKINKIFKVINKNNKC